MTATTTKATYGDICEAITDLQSKLNSLYKIKNEMDCDRRWENVQDSFDNPDKNSTDNKDIYLDAIYELYQIMYYMKIGGFGSGNEIQSCVYEEGSKRITGISEEVFDDCWDLASHRFIQDVDY